MFWIRFYHPPWGWVKLQERVLESVIQLHDGGLVAASVAVVGRGEDGDDVPVVGPVVSLHDQLVGPGHQVQPVAVVERLGDVLTEGVASSAGRYSPASAVIGVGPEEVTHGTLVWDLLEPVQSSDMVQRVDTRGEAAVQTEYLAVNQCGQWQVVE